MLHTYLYLISENCAIYFIQSIFQFKLYFDIFPFHYMKIYILNNACVGLLNHFPLLMGT